MKHIKDKFFTGLFSVLLQPVMFIISIIFWYAVYWKVAGLTNGVDALEYGFITTIVIFGIILFLRFRYFYDIQKGWTREQVYELLKFRGEAVRDPFAIKFWVGVIGICIGIILLSSFYDQNLIVMLIPTLVISTLSYIVLRAYGIAKTEGKIKNTAKLKHLAFAFVPLGIAGIVIFLITYFGQILGVYSFLLLPLMLGFSYWGYDKMAIWKSPTGFHLNNKVIRSATNEVRYGNKALKVLGIFGGIIVGGIILIQDINSISKIAFIVGVCCFVTVLVWRRKNNGKPSIRKL